MEQPYTETINDILKARFKDEASSIFDKSELLQYIALKTRSANKGAKSRGSFANLYSLYVVIEDYLEKGFDKKSNYSNSEGAEFTKLFKRQEIALRSKASKPCLEQSYKC